MHNKHYLLASLLFSACPNAAFFNEGDAVLFAYNSTNDNTYFMDLGVSGQDLVNSSMVSITDSGLASFLSSNNKVEWGLLGSINDSSLVGGPPATSQSFFNSGIVGTSLLGNSSIDLGFQLEAKRLVLNSWIEDIQNLSGGSSSFGVNGSNNVSMDINRSTMFFDNNLAPAGYSINDFLWFAQTYPEYGSTLSDPISITNISPKYKAECSDGAASSGTSLSTDGIFRNNAVLLTPPEDCQSWPISVDASSLVPIPSAVWLFGSTLLGLSLMRGRRSK